MRVEDYEAYYRKQKADSNCGFAEEFEVRCNKFKGWWISELFIAGS